MSWCAVAPCATRLCQGKKGRCSTTGKLHIELRGKAPGSNVSWTKKADGVPAKLQQMGRQMAA